MANTFFIDNTTVIVAAWLNDINNHVYVSALNKHPATDIAFTPTGNILSTAVQSALAELDTKAVHLAGTETITGDKTFSGQCIVANQPFGDSSTKAANTAFVQAAVGGGTTVGTSTNLKASATGTNANVSITADEVAVETTSFAYFTLRGVSLSLNTASTGAGGIDTGTVAASTWYYVWLIYNANTLTTSVIASLSNTAPTMPAGYTYKALVTVIRTDGTANKFPLSFIYNGNTRMWQYKLASGSNLTSFPVMASGVAGTVGTTLVAVAVGNYVPPIACEIDIIGGAVSGSFALQITANNSTAAVTDAHFYYNNGGSGQSLDKTRMALESTNIYWASTLAACRLAISSFTI